jgi:hypothetical protein
MSLGYLNSLFVTLISMSEIESELEEAFYKCWKRTYSLPPTLQYHFHTERQWRFDFCWPEHKVAVEIQGQGPGHCSLKGMTNDCDKGNAARLLGWTVLYFTSSHLGPSRIVETCELVAKFLRIYHAPNITLDKNGFRPYIPASKRKRWK